MNPELKKIIDNFNNLNDQTRYAVLGGVVLLVILLDVFFLTLPQIGSIADINDQVTKITTDTQQVLTDRARINILKKDLQDKRDLLKSLAGRVRSPQEVPAILSAISSIANEYGVKIDQLTPEKSLQEALTTDGNDKYFALPVVIKASCGYHQFGHFLNRLENEDMFFIMKDFVIQNDDKGSSAHNYSLTIDIILGERPSAKT